MKIELNDKEYRTLMEHMTLGWFIFGILSDYYDNYDKKNERSEKLVSKLLSYTDDKNIYEIDKHDKKRHLSQKNNDKVREMLDDYGDFIFWDRLARELAKKYVPIDVRISGDEMQILEEEFKIVDVLQKEFEENGLGNVKLDIDL